MRVVAAAALLLAVLASSVLAQTDVLEVQAVPETSGAARHLLQSSESVGGYYGNAVLTSYGYGYGSGRHLLQSSSDTAGGYGMGTYGMSTGGYGYGYGYGSGRRLIEDDIILEPSDPLLQYAEQRAAADTAAAAAPNHAQPHDSSSSKQQLSIPAGKCYCRYDADFSTWALAEDTCKEALYQRCKTESALPCAWLDKFYAPVAGPGFSMPHEADIKAFVHEDCSPSPPCACTDVKFDGTDPVSAAVTCCRDLRVACKTPFSGVHCKKVEAFCSDDKPTPILAAWSQHVLHHSDCSDYNGLPFQFVRLQDLQPHTAAAAVRVAVSKIQEAVQPAAEAAAAATEAALISEVMHSWYNRPAASTPSTSDQHQRRLVIVLAAITAGAVCVAVAAVVFAMQREEAAAVRPISSSVHEPLLSSADVYQSLVKSAALAAPKPAACVGTGYGLPPAAPLRRDESGDSCLSRVISIGKLSSQGSDAREQHGLHRCVSNGSDAYSTGSDGDSML